MQLVNGEDSLLEASGYTPFLASGSQPNAVGFGEALWSSSIPNEIGADIVSLSRGTRKYQEEKNEETLNLQSC